jgi:hypothetical protein
MAVSFEVGPAALREAARLLREHAAHVRQHGLHLDSQTSLPVGKGPVGSVVERFVSNGLRIVKQDIPNVVAKYYEDIAAGLDRAASHAERTDRHAGEEFDKLQGHRGHARSDGAAIGAQHNAAGEDSGRNRVTIGSGYIYHLDESGRVSRVEGQLVSNPSQGRNRKAQLGAGGDDRLGTDEGGHFVGRRFDGPTDDFNHFAQNQNFNRGEYKKLENKWQAALEDGKSVYVHIEPSYPEGSSRPDYLEIRYTIDGELHEIDLPNEAKRD